MISLVIRNKEQKRIKIPDDKPILHFFVQITTVSFDRKQASQIYIMREIAVDPVWKCNLFLKLFEELFKCKWSSENCRWS